MASTPEIGNASTNRISPLGSGINKSLLTPCRRMGLSRKRKTPNSIVKMLSEDLNSSNNSIQDSSLIETTPVNHRKSFSRRKKTLLQLHASPLTMSTSDSGLKKQLNTDIETSQDCINSETKKDLSGRFASQDSFDSSKDILFVKNKAKETLENDSIKKLKKKLSTDESLCTKNSLDKPEGNSSEESFEEEVFKTKISNKSLRRLSDDDFVSSETVHESISLPNDKSNNQKMSSLHFENEGKINDSDEDFKIVSKCDNTRKQQKMEKTKHMKTTKKIRKIFAVKKSLSNTDDEFESDVSKKPVNNKTVKECKVQIQKLSEDEICLNEGNLNSDKLVFKKLTKKSTVDDDYDDDDAFTFTPEQEKNEKKTLMQKIMVMESQLKHKRQKFANLKQASIYKNKHDIEDLKRLTSQWVNGCVLGLNDLLSQLQTHGPMSMTTLMNNLNIPNEIITKLPLNNQ